MDIIWHGHSCFELVSGGYSAVIDPFQDTSVGTAYPHVRLTADAVYISHEDRDHNFREGVTLRNTGKANPFAVTELETYHDIMRGRLRGMNTVRIFAAEGMRVAHLGDLGAKPTPEQMQQLQGLDAMMIPVGGIYTIEPDTATTIPRSCASCFAAAQARRSSPPSSWRAIWGCGAARSADSNGAAWIWTRRSSPSARCEPPWAERSSRKSLSPIPPCGGCATMG